MKTLAAERPIVFSLVVMGILQVLLMTFLAGARLFAPDLPLEALDLPFLLLNAVVAIILLSVLGWWKETGFNRPAHWQRLTLYIFPFIVLMVPVFIVRPSLPPASQIVPMVIVMLLIGFQEEAIYRGVILRAMEPKGVMKAALFSALLFSVIHANSFLLGRDPMFVTSQIVASFFGGFALAAIRIRTGTIWFLILLHALNDFIQFTAIGGIEATNVAVYIPIAKVGISVIMFGYGLYILRGQWLPNLYAKAKAQTA